MPLTFEVVIPESKQQNIDKCLKKFFACYDILDKYRTTAADVTKMPKGTCQTTSFSMIEKNLAQKFAPRNMF